MKISRPTMAEHHGHPEVHALAFHVKEPTDRDIDNTSDQDDDP
jgi:hypothetical protein